MSAAPGRPDEPRGAVALEWIDVIDSHTGGEPTRIVVAGGPDLGRGPLAERRERFRREHDAFRAAVVNEPRGSDVLVGGLLCEPAEPGCAAGVIYFNNVGVLNMCVHGTIGLGVTLAHMGRLGPGEHRIDTPVGVVGLEMLEPNRVRVRNVPSYRARAGVKVEVPGLGAVTGDIAWGGNWFFLVEDHGEALELARVERLTDLAWRIRQALERDGIRGDDGGEIDHIELFGPPARAGADSRNFVLCPGKAYDRSPCGTGTSAKIACLLAGEELAPGEAWRQESIVGSVFEASGTWDGERVIPVITGTAYITGEARLCRDPRDPYRDGIQAR